MKVKFGKSALTAILLLTILLTLSSEIAANTPVFACSGTRCETISITCQPNPATQSGSATCTATVSDIGTASTTPTGKVTWTQSPVVVTFKSTSCTLREEQQGATWASCSVRVNCTGFGVTTITGEYSGNLNGSKGTFKLTVTHLA